MLDVSRQAVSKWEQGEGYPEVEKLLLLSSKLNISLDYLMSTEFAQQSPNNQRTEAGLITITSPYENVIVTCDSALSFIAFALGFGIGLILLIYAVVKYNRK